MQESSKTGAVAEEKDDDDDDDDDDEISSSPHQSHHQSPSGTLFIDVSLLDGLAEAMSDEECSIITNYMISGDCELIAKAVTILAGMAELIKSGGVLPHFVHRTPSQQEFLQQLMATTYTNHVNMHRAQLIGHPSQAELIQMYELQQTHDRKWHPLPARMPRYAWLDPFEPQNNDCSGTRKRPFGKKSCSAPPTLTFVDDVWDGTLSDAFAEIHVEPDGTVKKIKPSNTATGIGHLIKAAAAGGNKDVIGDRCHRVVIASVHGDAAKKGLCKGDVVTHVNGTRFHGTADDLVQIIGQIKQDGHEKVNLVVNAEVCVAEALRLRATC